MRNCRASVTQIAKSNFGVNTIIFFICFGSLFYSCRKEKTYNFTISNTTNYRIDNIEFSCAVDNKNIAIDANSISENFKLTYKKKIGRLFSEPLLCITIIEYSDLSNTYKNSVGQTFSIRELSNSNEFIIELQSNTTDKFNVIKK